jgi:hypothetical protein
MTIHILFIIILYEQVFELVFVLLFISFSMVFGQLLLESSLLHRFFPIILIDQDRGLELLLVMG